MFSRLFTSKSKHSSNPKGLIKYFDLIPFWENLTEEHRQILKLKYNVGLGTDSKNLTDTDVKTTQSKLAFLSGFLHSPTADSDESLFGKIIDQAESSISQCNDIVDVHFYLQSIIIYYYKKRKNRDFYELAKKSCVRQMEIAPKVKESFLQQDDDSLPRHYGYKQYCIILEKEGKYEEAISICTLAQDEGWNGDWSQRIEKLKTRLSR